MYRDKVTVTRQEAAVDEDGADIFTTGDVYTNVPCKLSQYGKELQSGQEALLTQANESLKEYAREEKRTRLRIKAQRNTWEAVAAGLLVAWAAK